MTIRPYKAEYRTACVTIFNSNTPRFFDPAESTLLELWLNAHDEGRLTHADNKAERFYVAEREGEIVACGGFCIPVGKPVANMAWGMVANAYHKQGIGKKLFEYRMQQITAGYPECSVILDTTQHTYGFFEKLGFAITGIKKDYYGKGLDRYDMELVR